MKLENVRLDSLTPDPKNARSHEQGIPELVESLTAFGQQKNLVVWHDTVIAGNGLLEAARQLGWTKIAISRTPDEWSYEQAQAFALADNKTAELSEWDTSTLTEIRFDLDSKGWDTDQYGFEPLQLMEHIEFDASPQLGDVGYAIIVTCAGEQEQAVLLETFAAEGLNARPLML
jgi:site-specific DNA-methyltransferase (adenine-specific)